MEVVFPPCPVFEGLVRAVGGMFFFFFDRLSACGFADVSFFSSSVVQQRRLDDRFCSSFFTVVHQEENLNSPLIIFGLQKENQIDHCTNGCFSLGLKSALNQFYSRFFSFFFFLLFASYRPFFI